MITLDDIRGFALALPEVEEGTHFGLPSFKVKGKGFAGLQKDGRYALIGISPAEAEAAAAGDPGIYEAVWRSGRIFVGVRVDLAAVSSQEVQRLVQSAWRNKAPKRLVAAYDEGGRRGSTGQSPS